MNDLISRQAAIDAMCELMHHWFGGDSKDEIREIKRELENLPSAQPERKKGKWIKHIDDLFPAESTIECSECHHEQPLTIDDNYCPNCGSFNGGENEV